MQSRNTRPSPRLRLDVLVPTWNRAAQLARAATSVLTLAVPSNLDVVVVPVDNGSDDDTAEAVQRLARAHPGRIRYVCERRRGKSRALNTGIRSSTADLVGMIDDDEEVGPEWLSEIATCFADPHVDFIGGPYVPVWSTARPGWIPGDYLAVIGDVNNGPEPHAYGPAFPGILKGGNAVVRRAVLEGVGGYAEHLGPARDARLLSCEDEEMYHRLLAWGARGLYRPKLLVFHHVSPERLDPTYYRRWCFWRGVSRGLMDRSYPVPVSYLAGAPRFLFGRAARGVGALAARVTRRASWERSFSEELAVWDLAGFLWGKHVYPLARHLPTRSRRNGPGGRELGAAVLPSNADDESCG